MSESYSVKAVLSATDNGFSSTLRNAMGVADSFGNKIKSGFNFGILTGMGQAAFGVIKNGISGMIGEISSSNAAWKTFNGNMSILGKSASEIRGAKKELQAFAESTVYSSSDMAQTFAQLEAVGTKNTTKLVKGFGGLAAAAENPQQAMKTLSQQATQMAAKPTVAWADFKLMLEQTPAGMAAVAKEMGMTSAELVTAIQAGEVKTEDFFDAIQKVGTSDGFSKLATEYKTVGQAMDGLKETVGNKLTPAFDVLSKVGIKAVSGLADKLGKIDANALATKVQSAVDTAGKFLGVLRKNFSGVGKEVVSALKTLGKALGITKGEFSKTDALNAFSKACKAVRGAISKVTKFIEDNKETIKKYAPLIKGLVIAFVGMKVANTVAPGLTSFAGGLALMAGKGIAGLAGKLFGIAGGTKATGDAAKTSTKQMLAAAGAFLMTAAAVLLIAGGFALMAQTAIALANAGGLAIGVMAGMVIALVGLGIGMTVILKTLSAFGTSALMAGAAMLMLGGAVLLIAAGFALMAQSSIALASAGWGAIAVMVGMVAAIALLAIGAAALGTALTAGAVGFIAFGAAILMVGVGAVLAGAALAIVAAVLPAIVANGLQGALAIAALGASLAVFAVGAALAGVAALVLGAGLLVVAAAVVVLAAGVLALSAGCLITAAALAVVALVLPKISEYGLQGAHAITALGAALVVFAVGAGVAGAACLVLGAAVLVLGTGMLMASAGVLICAAGLALIAASMLIIGANALIAAVALQAMAAVLPLVTQKSVRNAASMAVLAAGLLTLGAAALVAGAGALTFGAGLLVAAAGGLALAVAIAAVGVAVMALAAGTALASASIVLLSAALPKLAAVSGQGSIALLMLGAAMVVFGAGAIVAGAGALVLGAGIAVAAVAIAAMAVAVSAMSVATLAASGAIAVLASALPKLSAVSTEGAAALTLVGAALLAFGAGAVVAGVSATALSVCLTAFGAAMLVSAAGTLAMNAALKGVSYSMGSIASDAKRAEQSLDSMQDSVDVVQSGLDALGDKAKSAMKKLTNAFDDTASDAKDAGKKVGTGFTDGMKSGLVESTGVATSCVIVVNMALLSGVMSAYNAGANISRGFANGMLSMLGVVRTAAAQMAAAADKAIRAKAKIHSPSRVSEGLGSYWGKGFVNGIADMTRDAWRAAENLVSAPSINTPKLAMAYAGELSSDYRYHGNAEYTIEVPLSIDGREVGKATARYTQEEIDRQQTRESRKHGKV
jgi:hypothetical protein